MADGDATGASTAPGPGIADRARLFGILSGTWLAQSCYALVKLGIPDLMAAGPCSVTDLARASNTSPRALQRVLRAVAAAGLVRETAPGSYELTPMAQPLRSGVRRSSHDAAVMFGEEVFRSFAEITYTLRTGKPAFEKVYGKPFYDYLADNPDAAATFSAAMGDGPVPAALATCDLTGLRLLVDVGGGNGGLLARVLRAHPAARGILVELPPAIRQAKARLSATDIGDRVDFVAASFFDAIPADGDVYVLSRVLHNWDDDDVLRLLGAVREAIPPDGRLLVFEELIEPAGAGTSAPAGDTGGPGAASARVMDLLILLMLSGSDRTEAEYRSLLAQAGFQVSGVRPGAVRARQTESVIEAVPG